MCPLIFDASVHTRLHRLLKYHAQHVNSQSCHIQAVVQSRLPKIPLAAHLTALSPLRAATAIREGAHGAIVHLPYMTITVVIVVWLLRDGVHLFLSF